MSFEMLQKENFEHDLKKRKPSIKNTSSSVIINLKDWEKEFIESLIAYMQLADCTSDEYDNDPNDDKVFGKYLNVILDTIRSCLSNEWELVNNSQRRNDGCIKITFKQFEIIYSNLINSIISETDQLKNSNEKYVVPFIAFFNNTIKDYFESWWDRLRRVYDNYNRV